MYCFCAWQRLLEGALCEARGPAQVDATTGRVQPMATHQGGRHAGTVEHGALVAQPLNPLALRQSTTLLLLLLLTQPLQQQQVRPQAGRG